MVSWIFDGTSTVQQDMYSPAMVDPTVLATNAYTTTVTNTATEASFKSTRPLTPSEGDTYIIPLDMVFDTIWAY